MLMSSFFSKRRVKREKKRRDVLCQKEVERKEKILRKNRGDIKLERSLDTRQSVPSRRRTKRPSSSCTHAAHSAASRQQRLGLAKDSKWREGLRGYI
jgi:hypothetical protein